MGVGSAIRTIVTHRASLPARRQAKFGFIGVTDGKLITAGGVAKVMTGVDCTTFLKPTLETVRPIAAETDPKGIVGRNVFEGSSVNRQSVAADSSGDVVNGSASKPGDCGVMTSA